MKYNNKHNFLGGLTSSDVSKNLPADDDQILNPFTGLSECDQHIKLELGLPKFKRENIMINIKDQVVSVHGYLRNSPAAETEKKFSFEKSFRIPPSIDPKNIRCDFQDKMLSLIMPKNSLN